MQLDRIAVALRPRAAWEAVDLGATLLRANAWAVWTAWFAATLPLAALAVALGVALGHPWLGLVLVWWCLPLFDRVPLYVLSRAAFAHAPGWREALRGQWRLPWRPTLAALSWLRIDSHRALRLPLQLLEGSPPRQRAARWKVLRRRLVQRASLLTHLCFAFEWIVAASLAMLVWWLLPPEWRPLSPLDLWRDTTQPAALSAALTVTAFAYLAVSLIEPWYVACGFALYLNRRTELEAWDIELAFRRLRGRLLGAGKVLAVVLLCAGWLLAAPARAAVPPVAAATVPAGEQQRFDQAAGRVFRDPRFGGEHRDLRWVWKGTLTPAPRQARPAVMPLHWLPGLVNAALWLMLAGGVIALAWLAWRWRGRWTPRADVHADTAVHGRVPTGAMDATPLPRDLAVAARAHWQAGRRREALALVYRGCVQRLAERLQHAPAADATEADWLRQATRLDDAAARQQVAAIVRVWQFAAYAGHYPDDARFERLLAGWPVQAGGAP